jgi:hypothetical protein
MDLPVSATAWVVVSGWDLARRFPAPEAVIAVLGIACAVVGRSLGKDLRSQFDTGASIVGMCDGFAIMNCHFWDEPAG